MPALLDSENQYCSGLIWCTAYSTSLSALITLSLESPKSGSTAMWSLFCTSSDLRSFRKCFRIVGLLSSLQVWIIAKQLRLPRRIMNQLQHLHFRLFPACTLSGRKTKYLNAVSILLSSCVLGISSMAFLLPSSQSVVNTNTAKHKDCFSSSRHCLQALRLDMC